MVGLGKAQSAKLPIVIFGQMIKGKETKEDATLVFQELRKLLAMKVARVQVKTKCLGDCSRDDFDKDVEIEEARRRQCAPRIQYDDSGEACHAVLWKTDIIMLGGSPPGRP